MNNVNLTAVRNAIARAADSPVGLWLGKTISFIGTNRLPIALVAMTVASVAFAVLAALYHVRQRNQSLDLAEKQAKTKDKQATIDALEHVTTAPERQLSNAAQPAAAKQVEVDTKQAEIDRLRLEIEQLNASKEVAAAVHKKEKADLLAEQDKESINLAGELKGRITELNGTNKSLHGDAKVQRLLAVKQLFDAQKEITELREAYQTAMQELGEVRQLVDGQVAHGPNLCDSYSVPAPGSDSLLSQSQVALGKSKLFLSGEALERSNRAERRDRDVEEPVELSNPRSQAVGAAAVSFLSFCFATGVNLVSVPLAAFKYVRPIAGAATKPLQDACVRQFNNLFTDPKNSWKERRYGVLCNELLRVFEDAEIKVSELAGPDKKRSKDDSAENVDWFYTEISSAFLVLSSHKINQRERYHGFQSHLRAGLLILRNNPHLNIPENIKHTLNAVCFRWFTQATILKNLKDIALRFAKNGNSEIVAQMASKPLLSEKMELLYDAQDKAPYEAALLDLLAGKVKKLHSSFDPLAHTNAPWQYATQVYTKNVEVPKSITHFRTGVPVGPRQSGDDAFYRDADKEIVPEYLAFLDGLAKEKKQLVSFLHLNPAYYNAEADTTESNLCDIATVPSQEGIWLKLMIQVSKQYKDNVNVVVLPFDGEFFDELLHPKARKTPGLDKFRDDLIRQMLEPKGPFVFPKKLGNKEELEAFLRETSQFVCSRYVGRDIEQHPFNQEKLKAFLGLFYTHLQEAIQIKLNADYVQNNCVDGIDRTAEIMGAKLAVSAYALGRLQDPQFHEDYIGCVSAPALAICKRPVLKSRRHIQTAVLAYLDKLPPVKEAVIFNLLEDWKLSDLILKADPLQTMVSNPADYADPEMYVRALQAEVENPNELPSNISLPKAISEALASLKKPESQGVEAQRLRDIGSMTSVTYNEYKCADTNLKDGECRFTYEQLKDFLEGDLGGSAESALVLMTQGTWEEAFQFAARRYTNEVFSCSGAAEGEGNIAISRNIETGVTNVVMQRSYAIKDLNSGKIVASVKMEIKADIEKDKPFVPVLRWISTELKS